MTKEQRRSRLRVLPTGDKQSRFYNQQQTPEEILTELGYPRYVLSSSAKAEKSSKFGVLNRVLYLTSGVFCPNASPGCLSTCLGFSSGRMRMPRSTDARDRRSALYLHDPEHFLALLRADLWHLREEAKAQGMIAAARLNGTSDLPWERLHGEIFEEFEDTQFFDYTKSKPRMNQFLSGRIGDNNPWPTNYHLTFSLSEKNPKEATTILQAGGNVAVVFSPWVPSSTWCGYPVIDGDRHDARFLDPSP